MSDTPPSNVKIYDRPERKAPSPVLLIVGALITLLVIFLLYKVLHHSGAPVNATSGLMPVYLNVASLPGFVVPA